MGTRKRLGLALATMGLLGVAACGSGDSGDDASEPLRILAVSGQTGLLKEPAVALVRGATARIDAINEAGGINGRKVELISKDNQSDPTRGVTLIQQAIEGDDTPDFVLTGVGSSESLAAAPILSRSKVVGMASATQPLLNDVEKFPYFFSSSVLQDVIYEGIKTYITAEGDTRSVALVVPGDAVGEAVQQFFDKVFASSGLTTKVYRYPSDAIDATPVFQKVVADDPDWIIMDGSGAQITSLITSRFKAGADDIPTILGASASSNSNLLEVATAEQRRNLSVSLQPLQAFIEPAERGEQYNDLVARLKKQGPITQPLTTYASGWNSVEFFRRAVESIDGDVTGDAIKEALETLPTSDDPQFPLFGKGGTYSATSHFRPGEAADFHFGRLVSIEDGISTLE